MKLIVVLLVFIFIFAWACPAQSNHVSDLRIFFTSDGAGIMGRSGEVIVKPEFESMMGEIDAGCSCVMAKQKDGLWGVSGLDGTWLVTPKYDRANGFSEGFAAVTENDKFRFIDSTGKIIAGGFDWANPFSEGLASVSVAGKWGFIDTDGKIAIPLIYEFADKPNKYPSAFSPVDSFSEGLSRISREVERTVYIDHNGQTVFQLSNGTHGVSFSNDRAIISSFRSSSIYEDHGIIDKTGKIILKPTYRIIRNFSEGLAAFRQGPLWGYLDKNGVVAIKEKFDDASDFSEGIAAVKIGKKWGAIDRAGKVIIQPKYDLIEPFKNGSSRVELGDVSEYIDRQGNVVFAGVKK